MTTTTARPARSAARRLVDVDKLMGLMEIAVRFGVQKDTCWRWRNRGVLPPELVTVSGTPLWDADGIEEWGLQTGRLVRTEDGVVPASTLAARASMEDAATDIERDLIGEGAGL